VIGRQVRWTQRAIRIRRVKEPLLLTLCTSPPPQPSPPERPDASLAAPGPDLTWLDEELYEGVVSQTAVAASVRASPRNARTSYRLPHSLNTGAPPSTPASRLLGDILEKDFYIYIYIEGIWPTLLSKATYKEYIC